MSTNKSALGICKGNLLACHSLPPATFSRSTRVDNQMRRLVPRRYSPVFSDDLSRISRLVPPHLNLLEMVPKTTPVLVPLVRVRCAGNHLRY